MVKCLDFNCVGKYVEYPTMNVGDQKQNSSTRNQKEREDFLLPRAYYADQISSVTKRKQDENHIKNLAVTMLDQDVYKSIVDGDKNNPKLLYLINELSDNETREKVFNKLQISIQKVIDETDINNDKDYELVQDLETANIFITIMNDQLNKSNEKTYSTQIAFKGGSQEVISESAGEGFKELMGEALPIYRGAELVSKMAKGDEKAIVKASAATVDNIVLQPAKQAVAGAAAAKGAAIGGAIGGPGGALIGAGIGYFGTLIAWGKTRNKIVDKLMDD